MCGVLALSIHPLLILYLTHLTLQHHQSYPKRKCRNWSDCKKDECCIRYSSTKAFCKRRPQKGDRCKPILLVSKYLYFTDANSRNLISASGRFSSYRDVGSFSEYLPQATNKLTIKIRLNLSPTPISTLINTHLLGKDHPNLVVISEKIDR